MTRTFSPDYLLRVVVARRWVVLVPLAIGIATVPFLSRFAPERFRSETLILVVPQRVPDSYVKATVTESVEDRLPSITNQILSRSKLERIIQEMDLYRAERTRMVMEDVVAKMRDDVNVAVSSKEADSFRVSYVSDDVETARKVTERLASLYIEQNVSDRSNQAESTSTFLASQLADAKQRLIEQEKKLEEYKRTHPGQMPTQLQANLQAIQNANMQLQQVNDATNRAQERRLLIERQIGDIKAMPLAVPPAPIVTGDLPAASSASQQLDAARARLAAYLQRYTPDHPEVVSLERTIAELSQRIGEETPLGATATPTPERPLSPEEAAQKKKILDLQAEVDVIDHQLAANRAEDERLKKIIAAYQAKVDAVPTTELELVELTRDYSTLQAAYSSLLMKREDSLIAANLERRQIGEQFRVLDVASKPEKPYNQLQRLGVMSAGAGMGLMIGLLIIGFREYRDSSFRSEDEVHQLLKLPVLALIPVLTSDREVRAARRRRWAMDLAGSTILIAAVAVVVFWQF